MMEAGRRLQGVLGMGAVLLVSGAVFVVALTVLAEARTTAWWVRFCDFPRVQILVIAVALAPLAWFYSGGVLRVALLCAAGAVTVWHAAKMRRFTTLGSYESLPSERAEPAARVRVLIANVLMTNRNAAGLKKIVWDSDPDIVLLLEPDAWWETQLRELDEPYPHGLKCPLDNTYGMLLYSRLPISDGRIRFLLLEGVPSMFCRVRLPCGAKFNLYCVHPLPPGVNVNTTQRDAELVVIGREAKESGLPCVVAGDLNDVAWSYTTRLFQKVSGMLDPRAGRGFYNSYHAKWPILRWPLDHLFHSRSFRLARLKRLPPFGSDHFAILAELSYEPDGKEDQQAPVLESADRAAAREKLEEALEEGLGT